MFASSLLRYTVVGHLQQLLPVSGSFVFKHPHFLPIANVTGNYLSEKFKLFELEEAMQQKGDAPFCRALKICRNAAPEDIKLIKTREISETLQPQHRAFAQLAETWNVKITTRLIRTHFLGK